MALEQICQINEARAFLNFQVFTVTQLWIQPTMRRIGNLGVHPQNGG